MSKKSLIVVVVVLFATVLATAYFFLIKLRTNDDLYSISSVVEQKITFLRDAVKSSGLAPDTVQSGTQNECRSGLNTRDGSFQQSYSFAVPLAGKDASDKLVKILQEELAKDKSLKIEEQKVVDLAGVSDLRITTKGYVIRLTHNIDGSVATVSGSTDCLNP